MYGHVINCQTSAEVWSVLEKLFISDSKKGALSINDYVLKMRNITDMLSASGKLVSDEDLILYILGGLGPEFETIVVNIMSRSEAIFLQEVHYLLQSHEILLEQLSAAFVIDVPPATHITIGGVQNSNTNDGQFRGSNNRNSRPRNFSSPHQPQQLQHRPPPLQPQMPLVPSYPIQNSQQQQHDSTNTSPHAYIVVPDLESNSSWVLDSDATHHMTTDSNTLDVSDHYSGIRNVVVGNGQTLDISSVRWSYFSSYKSSKSLYLTNVLHVLHVLQITKNLISVAKFTQDNDVILEFDSHCCFVKDKKFKEILLQGSLKKGLYQLDISKVSSNRQFAGFSKDENVFLPHLATTSSTINKKPTTPSVEYSLQVNKIESTRCEEDNNMVLDRLGIESKLQNELGFCIACPLGKTKQFPFPTAINKTQVPFELVFSDVWGPAHTTSCDGYKYYIAFVDAFTNYTWIYPMQQKSQATSIVPQFIALVDRQFPTKLKRKTFLFRHPCPHVHQQNGKVERKHRSIVEIGLTLLPTPILHSKTPYELLFKSSLDFLFLKTFGCVCYPYLRPNKNHKLEYQSTQCTFIGYSLSHKGYLCLHLSGKVYISRSVIFYEKTFPYSSLPMNGSSPTSHTSSSSFTIPLLQTMSQTSSYPSMCPTTSRPVSPFVPSPPISAPSFHPMTTHSKVGTFKPKLLPNHITYLFTSISLLGQRLTTVSQALKNPNCHTAIVKEYQALVRNNTWTLVSFHPSMNVIDSKWIFRVKYNSDGTIQHYKARLVAKGFQQYADVEFTDTFSPVIKASTIRVVFTLIVTHNWEIRQIDFNNAFPNGEIAETVYISQSVGFKALYGLKQAPRAWFHKLKEALHTWGFISSKSDTFALKDLGLVKDFLRFEALRTTAGLHLTQSKYTVDLLTRTNMHSTKPIPTPMSATLKLHATSDPVFSDPTLYRNPIDIAFSVNKLSQYLQQPTELHWTVCKRVLRYLNGTFHHGLHFTSVSSLHLQVYTDANWASSINDCHSTISYCVFLGTNLLTWSSCKQSVVARSSTEHGYAIFFLELGISLVSTPVIWCDNQGVGALAANPIFHSRTKHIEVDVHYVREQVLDKNLVVSYVPFVEQVADLFTKPLSIPKFQYLLTKLNFVVSPGCA
ncbi:hypothetical protein AAG906_028604 [Vitis piasezkii]